SIPNKLRGSYMPDKYGDVIIPMTIIRRLECTLEETKWDMVETYKGYGIDEFIHVKTNVLECLTNFQKLFGIL
ncbi:MAG: hypothetical protein IKS36_05495, partial [Bacteroidales bacterium]|nr:hypothetical protein [Bacteroidales bacterium]